MSVFQDPALLDKLNPRYVFVGLNASGTHESRKDGLQCPWQGFHSSDNRRQHDFKLRYALMDTPYWGAYITDIIKEFPELKSENVKDYIKEHPEVLRDNIANFELEMSLLGERPTLIALGDEVYDILERNLGKKYTIRKIKHYSAWSSKEDYRVDVLIDLQGI